jgi:deoxycytidylate deaminase
MKKINSFDKKIMNLAVKISKKSDDPHTKVGAIIIDEKNNIIGKGYNHYLKTIPKNKRT